MCPLALDLTRGSVPRPGGSGADGTLRTRRFSMAVSKKKSKNKNDSSDEWQVLEQRKQLAGSQGGLRG